jgi:hypothetical protein
MASEEFSRGLRNGIFPTKITQIDNTRYQDVQTEWPADNERVSYINEEVPGRTSHSICVTGEETCFAVWYLLL